MWLIFLVEEKYVLWEVGTEFWRDWNECRVSEQEVDQIVGISNSVCKSFARKFRQRPQDIVLVFNQALLTAILGNISSERLRVFYITVLEIRCFWVAMPFSAVKFTDFTKKLVASIFNDQKHSSSIMSLIWDESWRGELSFLQDFLIVKIKWFNAKYKLYRHFLTWKRERQRGRMQVTKELPLHIC
jgi:hypothetical protein